MIRPDDQDQGIHPFDMGNALTPPAALEGLESNRFRPQVNEQCQMRQGGHIADVLVLGRSKVGRDEELTLLVLRSNRNDSVGKRITFRPSGASSDTLRLFPAGRFKAHKITDALWVYDPTDETRHLAAQARQCMLDLLELAQKERAESLKLDSKKKGLNLSLEINGRFKRFPAPPLYLLPALLERLKRSCLQVEADGPSLFKGEIRYSIRNLRRKASCFIGQDSVLLSFSRA